MASKQDIAEKVENMWNTTKWQSYNTYRPAYPPSLWELIFSHHRSNGGSFDAAHDIGAGAGQGASVLAQHFSNIYVSDPAQHNIDTAKAHLMSEGFHSSLPGGTSFHFSARAGEVDPTADDWIKPQSLDMITVCEALHWMDADQVLANSAKTLKPGSTFAAVYYAFKPMIVGIAAAENLWLKFNRMLLSRFKHVDQIMKGRYQSGTGLDFVGFPQQDWCTGVRRVYINMKPDAEGKWKSFKWAEESDCAESRITEADKIEAVVNDEGWSRMVDKDWFDGYMRSLYVQLEGASFKPDEEEIMDELKRTIGDGKVKVTWPVAVLLATRA